MRITAYSVVQSILLNIADITPVPTGPVSSRDENIHLPTFLNLMQQEQMRRETNRLPQVRKDNTVRRCV